MNLPHASLHEPTSTHSIRPGGLRKYLLVFGLLAGCGANHAIWSHAQVVQRAAAEESLKARIRAQHGYEPAFFSYIQRARGEWLDFLSCDGRGPSCR